MEDRETANDKIWAPGMIGKVEGCIEEGPQVH